MSRVALAVTVTAGVLCTVCIADSKYAPANCLSGEGCGLRIRQDHHQRGLIMAHPRRACCTLAAVAAALLASTHATGAQRDSDDKKPSLSLKATPPAGFAPLRVHLAVDVKGGPNDYADFYCPTVQWDWDDGTISETSEDCDPYEAGKSTIQRRFSADHAFRLSGEYRLTFRLKQKTKVISSATTTLTGPGVPRARTKTALVHDASVDAGDGGAAGTRA